jgi:hypothetical protein
MKEKNYPAVITFEEKHGIFSFIVGSKEGEKKCFLHVMKNRYADGWYSYKEVIKESIVKIQDKLELLKSVSPKIKLIDEEIENNEKRLKSEMKELKLLEEVERAVNENDPELAYRVSYSREDYEYEGFRIEYDVEEFK